MEDGENRNILFVDDKLKLATILAMYNSANILVV